MRRFPLPAIVALLLIAVATPANAGYLIIRIMLEGTGQGSSAEGGSGNRPGGGPGSPGSPGSPFGPGGGPGGPPGGLSGAGGGGKFPGGPGGSGSSAPPGAPAADPSHSVVVVVPIDEDLSISTPFYPRRNPNQDTNPSWRPKLHTNYRGEKIVTNLFTDGSTFQSYDSLLQFPAPKKTRITEVHDLHDRWLRSKKTEPNTLFNAINGALAAGMIEEAVAYSDEMVAYGAEHKDGLHPEILAFIATYPKMEKGIKGFASKPSKAEYWKQKLNASSAIALPHYALISWDATPAELRRRADILEENFRAFFLWHAIRGIEVAVPEAQQVVVLPKNGTDVFALAKALDSPGRLFADGFYSPDHEVFVLAPTRLDDVGMTFARQNQRMYQATFPREKLLAGDGPKLSVSLNPNETKPEEAARMQTNAIVDLFVEDAATVCAVSREGSRQLMYASQLLPRYVVLPDWLNAGSANFFARPKEPAFLTNGTGKPIMHVATATGYGIANYVQQRYFRDLQEKKELNPEPGALLKNIISDAYFHGLRDPKELRDPDPVKPDTGVPIGGPKGPLPPGQGPGAPPGMRPPIGGGSPGFPPTGMGGPGGGPGGLGGPPPGVQEEDPNLLRRKKRDRLMVKSQSTSWALYYYLAMARPTELRNFLNELAAMPRDMSLEGVSVQAFYRAFNLDGSKESLDKFARSWLDYMHTLTPMGIDITLLEPKPQSPANPNGSGPPGFNKQ